MSHNAPRPVNGSVTTPSLLLLTALCSLISFNSHAEQIAVPLSQEQDGGDAGRACIYVHNGKAEYRTVKSDRRCEPQIMIEREDEKSQGE